MLLCSMSGSGHARLAKRLYCRAAEAYYQAEHHCCTDNSLQCIMRSGMDSASDRVHFITSLVPAQLSGCNAIRRHPSLIRGPLALWINNLACSSLARQLLLFIPATQNAHVQIRHVLFVTTSLLERMLASHSYIIHDESHCSPLCRTTKLNSPPECY